jgi:hypothetical protein
METGMPGSLAGGRDHPTQELTGAILTMTITTVDGNYTRATGTTRIMAITMIGIMTIMMTTITIITTTIIKVIG